MKTVDTFLFDLGGVFVNYDPMIAVRRFCRDVRGCDEGTLLHLLFKSDLHHRFERGLLSAEAFHRCVLRALDAEISFSRFKAYWQEIFRPIEPMIGRLDAFSRRFRLGLVSNTNVLHMDYLKSVFGFFRHFSVQVYSFEVGHAKPEAEIFRIALDRCGTHPDACVFVDDSPDNVRAAEGLGISAIRFAGPDQFWSEAEMYWK